MTMVSSKVLTKKSFKAGGGFLEQIHFFPQNQQTLIPFFFNLPLYLHLLLPSFSQDPHDTVYPYLWMILMNLFQVTPLPSSMTHILKRVISGIHFNLFISSPAMNETFN